MFKRGSDDINYRKMWFAFKEQCLKGSQSTTNLNRSSADLTLKLMDKIEIEYQMRSCSVKDRNINKGGINNGKSEQIQP